MAGGLIDRLQLSPVTQVLCRTEDIVPGALQLTPSCSRVQYPQMAIVTLTTDFGVTDGYVGTMKGVILSIAPEARLVDLSHQVPPQDVRRAAFLLYAAAPFFPPGTVHLAVVDPGVGTRRRAVALQIPHGCFVGPDNGLFTYVLGEAAEWTAVELADPAYHLPIVSETFHGRDLFAPVAAHLAAGVSLEELGPSVVDLVALPLPRLAVGPDGVEGEVLHADRFGNLVTSVGRLRWEGAQLSLTPAFRREPLPPVRVSPGNAQVKLAGRALVGIRRTYGEVGVGELLALVGSAGFLEVAVCQGSAAAELGARPGERVCVHFQ
jgi:S-adenosylmethionine hydrolase